MFILLDRSLFADLEGSLPSLLSFTIEQKLGRHLKELMHV
jgi:hypothetical protein